eukprot:6183709-Pleurochrysis_carterae.AAC.2
MPDAGAASILSSLDRFYELNGCRVEVKEAVPREHMRKEGLAAQAAQNKEFRKSGAAFDEASQAYGYEGYAEQAASPSANYRYQLLRQTNCCRGLHERSYPFLLSCR